MEARIPETTPLVIRNDGADIVETNYWTTRAGRNDFCYLSGNAGALRLLVPQNLSDRYLPEMRTGKSVSIETSIASPACIDVVFDDGSKTPFYIALDRSQTDRVSGGARRNVPFTVWTPSGKALSLTAVIDDISSFLAVGSCTKPRF
jgi:hypothetical protein